MHQVMAGTVFTQEELAEITADLEMLEREEEREIAELEYIAYLDSGDDY